MFILKTSGFVDFVCHNFFKKSPKKAIGNSSKTRFFNCLFFIKYNVCRGATFLKKNNRSLLKPIFTPKNPYHNFFNLFFI